MTPTSRSNFLLTFVFTVSLALGSFWYFTSALAYLDTRSLGSVALLIAPTFFALILAFGSTRSIVPLKLPDRAERHALTAPLIVGSLLTYLLLLPAFWGLGHLVARTWQDPTNPEADVFKVLFALWLPPWWAPAFGAIAAWLWITRRMAAERSRGAA